MRIKNLPVEEQELLHWLTTWRKDRELAFSAMPHALYAFVRQERYIDADWDLTDRGENELARLAASRGERSV